MKLVANQDPKIIDMSKYVFTAGVLAGACYRSYQQVKKAETPARPIQRAIAEAKPKAAAVAVA